MFFASIVLLPLVLGALAGALFGSRRPTDLLAGLCVLAGVAGAVAIGLDPDTTGRAGAVAFGVVAGLVAALLVYAGNKAGTAARQRRDRHVRRDTA